MEMLPPLITGQAALPNIPPLVSDDPAAHLGRVSCHVQSAIASTRQFQEPETAGRFGIRHSLEFTGGVQRDPRLSGRRAHSALPVWVLPRPARAVMYRAVNAGDA